MGVGTGTQLTVKSAGVDVTGNLEVTGEIRQGGTDYGGYEIQTPGQLYVNDYGVFCWWASGRDLLPIRARTTSRSLERPRSAGRSLSVGPLRHPPISAPRSTETRIRRSQPGLGTLRHSTWSRLRPMMICGVRTYPTRLYARRAGRYLIIGEGRLYISSTGYARGIKILKNGIYDYGMILIPPQTAYDTDAGNFGRDHDERQ